MRRHAAAGPSRASWCDDEESCGVVCCESKRGVVSGGTEPRVAARRTRKAVREGGGGFGRCEEERCGGVGDKWRGATGSLVLRRGGEGGRQRDVAGSLRERAVAVSARSGAELPGASCYGGERQRDVLRDVSLRCGGVGEKWRGATEEGRVATRRSRARSSAEPRVTASKASSATTVQIVVASCTGGGVGLCRVGR